MFREVGLKYGSWGGNIMAPRAQTESVQDHDDKFSAARLADHASTVRGYAVLGVFAGVFVVGMSFGMALPHGVGTRVAVATIGVVLTFVCLRVARQAKDTYLAARGLDL